MILATCKDIGGKQGLLPVVHQLRKNYKVALIAEGVAYEKLRQTGENCQKYAQTSDVILDYPRPDAFLTSMDFNGGIGRDLIPMFKSVCPTVALQSYWAEYLTTAWKDEKYRPDFITVNDDVGLFLVKKYWPEYPIEQIKIAGFPALDELATFDVSGISVSVRKKLGLEREIPVVTFIGQAWHTGHALSELIAAIDVIGQDVYLIPRPHPSMATDFSFEMTAWENALASAGKHALLVNNSAGIDSLNIVAASTVTLSMHSTLLVKASVLRKQNIAVLYPGFGLKMFLKDFPGGKDEFPIIPAGCTREVGNRKELVTALKLSYDNSLNQTEAQQKMFKLDGNNAKRVADFVESII